MGVDEFCRIDALELPVALANQRGSFSHYPASNVFKVNSGRRAPLGKVADPHAK
jgi:hypothetical protein